jgi:UDP-N-acetylglucosamine acyltransferase
MIHPTAIVETSGSLSEDIEIGPYAILMGDISAGEGCRIEAHGQLVNQVVLGNNCAIGSGSVIGGDPQDISFDPATISGVTLGNDNIIRENVTIHRSSSPQGFTRLGHRNYFRAGAHVGHDVLLGDDNLLGNGILLGGHAVVGNNTILGGGSALHQFIRIGDLSKVSDLGGLSLDLPPFLTVTNIINALEGINYEGLRNAGFSDSVIEEIENAYNLFVAGDMNLSQALAAASAIEWHSPEARSFIDFFKTDSKKGFCSKIQPI